MSALAYIAEIVIPASMKLLPPKMDSLSARAMLLAIGLQESRFEHRRQVKGPARSYWQAESGGGFRGILFHAQTKVIAREVLERTGYGEPDESDFLAIEHNDILACCGARLLLWTLPDPLPAANEVEKAWRQYIAAWRPGKPHPASWPRCYSQAWGAV